MSIGLLVITHNRIGADILTTAQDILGRALPINTRVIEIKPDSVFEQKLSRAQKDIEELDSGEGVLILTDLFGATPANIAKKAASGHNAAVVCGINLPMVVRVLNYFNLPLKKIVYKATSAGHDSIIESK